MATEQPGAPTRVALLSGWGRTSPSTATVLRPDGDASLATSIAEVLAAAPRRGVIARGLGRSYGDAAQCAGGTVIDLTGDDRVLAIDRATGAVASSPDAVASSPDAVVRVGAGASIDGLLRALVPQGLFVPVTPGTRFVTMGGAVAADVHGKNHHRDGSVGSWVRQLELATPTGARQVGPSSADPDDRALYWATVGGMGLTGVVVEVELGVIAITTSQIRMDTSRAGDLDEAIELLKEADRSHRYSVAWIDCVARGASMGRAVITAGDHAELDDLPAAERHGGSRRALAYDPRVRLGVPPVVPSGLLNPLSVRAFNEVWFRKAPKREVGRVVPLAGFFHPLDGVSSWNRLYGPRGFIQYQVVVPDGAEGALRRIVERLSQAGLGSFLAVLKRFGPANQAPLSFPIAGWTLALDLAVGPVSLAQVLDELDQLVASAGGRVYLAKDSRVRPELIEAMYPRLGEWRKVRDRVDPSGVMTSDLSRRLNLVGSP